MRDRLRSVLLGMHQGFREILLGLEVPQGEEYGLAVVHLAAADVQEALVLLEQDVQPSLLVDAEPQEASPAVSQIDRRPMAGVLRAVGLPEFGDPQRGRTRTTGGRSNDQGIGLSDV